MKRKIITVLLTCLMVFSASACGEKADTSSGSENDTPKNSASDSEVFRNRKIPVLQLLSRRLSSNSNGGHALLVPCRQSHCYVYHERCPVSLR